MTANTFDDIPIRQLYRVARKQHLRVCLTIDGPIGRSYLDTLDVWDGRPGAVGSRLAARASLAECELNEAAAGLILELTSV